MASFKEVLHQSQDYLTSKDVYPESAQLLLLELSNQENADLYLHFNDEMPEELEKEYRQKVERLANNEPLQYILGYQWFYGRTLKVNENVLIPRNETEELVANILSLIDEYFYQQEISLVDIGTGSGAIAISLALEEKKLKVMATDISAEAIAVAQENSDKYNAGVEFMVGDMLEPLIEKNIKVDVLISNPPYIPVNQEIDTSVKDYEPHVALFGGDDGLWFYQRIFEKAYQVIKDKAFLGFEIGYDEKDRILALANNYFPNDTYEVLQDINGKDRMLFIYHNL